MMHERCQRGEAFRLGLYLQFPNPEGHPTFVPLNYAQVLKIGYPVVECIHKKIACRWVPLTF